MKKEVGKRTYSEMYLITKENKDLLDKCDTHLNQKHLGKHDTQIKKYDKLTQTSNIDGNGNHLSIQDSPSSDESVQDTNVSKETNKMSIANVSPISENASNQSDEMMIYGGEIVPKSNKVDMTKKKKLKRLRSPDIQFGLVSPVSTRSKKKDKFQSDSIKYRNTNQYENWSWSLNVVVKQNVLCWNKYTCKNG